MSIKKSLIKIISYIPKGGLATGLYFLSKSHLKKEGWNNSFIKKMPIDAAGNELPWFTYGSIHFLKQKLNKNLSVFEYGSGNSTIWFSQRVKKITSIEHDIKWYNSMEKSFSNINNINYVLSELETNKYQNEISKYKNQFDIIIIDGRKRIECSLNSIVALKDGGIIIWDNTERTSYNEAYDFLIQNGFRRLDFWGMGPINHHSWCTSIFYKDNNCLGI